MPFTTNDLMLMTHVDGISHDGIRELSERTFRPFYYRKDLANWMIENQDVLGINGITHNKIAEGFNKGLKTWDKNEEHLLYTVSMNDREYPNLLRDLPSPPLLLHVRGDLRQLNEKPSIAVIGSNHPTEIGRGISELFGQQMGENGISVVGRLVPGIDEAAQKGCLDRAGTPIIVMPHGLDALSPKDNLRMANRIIENGGTLVSEYEAGNRHTPKQIMECSRIQAGLSKCVTVVEAGLQGNAMRTAEKALEYGRTLAVSKYLFPGSTKESLGNDLLLNRKGEVMKLEGRSDLDKLISMSKGQTGQVLKFRNWLASKRK